VAGLSFDSAVLVGLERGDERAWAWLRRAAEHGVAPVVSAAAVAEAWRGGAHSRLRKALDGCAVVPVDDRLARVAGGAVAAVGATPLDAIIAVTAADVGLPLVTGDADDMHALLGHFRALRVLTL
jgi:predicted nucleic acid-binding protein